jgi:hypothetical protein
MRFALPTPATRSARLPRRRQPPRRRPGPRRRAVAALATTALALAVTACGAEPPQPPKASIDKLASATSAISTACGKAYLLTAFGGPHPSGLKRLDATASSSAHTLALVDRRNPNWFYLGATVHKIVAESVAMLGACGLDRARTRLLHETARH